MSPSTSPSQPLDKTWLLAHIPHQGSMCLLDEVLTWDDMHIVCRSHSHTLANNPLRAAGRLGAANGVEYAAQAMAAHGALLAGADAAPKAGYLTSLRNVRLAVNRLDTVPQALHIQAERLMGDDNHIQYSFQVHADDAAHTLLLEGRASVMLNAAQHQPLAV